MLTEETIYGLYCDVYDYITNIKLGKFNDGKPVEIGHQYDLIKKIPAYEGNFNVNKDGKRYKFYTKRIGETSWESLQEDIKLKPYVIQQGEDDLEYIGFAKSKEDALMKVSDFVYDSTFIYELDEEIYQDMKNRHMIDAEDIKELDAYFAEENIDEELPTEVEISFSELNADTLEYYGLEDTIKMYLQKTYNNEVSHFEYYWYDVDTILVHDIEWKKEVKESIVEEVKEIKLSDVSVGQSFKVLDDVYYCDVQYEGMFEDDEELLDRFLDAGFKLVGTDLYIQKDTELKYEMSQSVDVYRILMNDFTFDVGEWTDDALNTSVEIIDKVDENIDRSKNELYNNTEDLNMTEEKKLEESIEELKKKYPNAKVLEYDCDKSAFIISKEELDNWEY